jgi:hypothetical protein
MDEIFKRLANPPPTEEDAWFAGYSAGKRGANMSNCHSRFFSTPGLTQAWERGQRAGSWERNQGGADKGEEGGEG